MVYTPMLPFTMRAMPQDFFKQDPDGAYRIDLAEKLGCDPDGFAFVASTLEVPVPKEVNLSIACLGSCKLWLNGENIFSSTFEDEIHIAQPHRLKVTLPAGRNTILILCRRTTAGFGCLISLPPITVCSALPQNEGMAGWNWTGLLPAFTSAMTSGHLDELLTLPWHPLISDTLPSPYVLWTRALGIEGTRINLTLICRQPTDCYVNGEKIQSCSKGTHTLSVPLHNPMNIHLVGDGEIQSDALLVQPIPVQGRKEPWLCAPIQTDEVFEYERFTSPTDTPWQNVRLFYEGALRFYIYVKTSISA